MWTDTFLKLKIEFFLKWVRYNAVELPNTLHLERERNWTGLLIEPNAHFYRELTAVNRKTYTLNACLRLDNKIGIAKFMSTALIRGVKRGFTNIMKKRVKNENPETSPADALSIPIDLILTPLQMYHIHLFSLYVEGAELDILKTIPFDEVQIDTFFIEYVAWNNATDVSASEKHLKEFRQFFKNLEVYREIYFGELDVARIV